MEKESFWYKYSESQLSCFALFVNCFLNECSGPSARYLCSTLDNYNQNHL